MWEQIFYGLILGFMNFILFVLSCKEGNVVNNILSYVIGDHLHITITYWCLFIYMVAESERILGDIYLKVT